MLRGNQHGGREYDDLQSWLDMTSHEKPVLGMDIYITKVPGDWVPYRVLSQGVKR